jgi:uncharacterized membrane protein
MNQKIVHCIILTLIVINIILSSVSYMSSRSQGVFCVLKSDCSEVQKSKYGEVFGIKVSLLGTIAFVLLITLYSFALRKREIYLLFVIANGLATLFALWFVYLQFFVLTKICSSCMFIDFISIAIFLLAIYEFVKYKKDYKSIFSYLK